jgi:hypothetical protein
LDVRIFWDVTSSMGDGMHTKRRRVGVIDLKKHNEALLLKNLDKFFNKKDIP